MTAKEDVQCAPSIEQMMEEATSNYVYGWSARCGEFLDWQREHMFLGNPSAELKQTHKHALEKLLTRTGILHSLVLGNRQLAKELSGRLGQLELSLEMVNNTMSEEEANSILAKVFPDEPRA